MGNGPMFNFPAVPGTPLNGGIGGGPAQGNGVIPPVDADERPAPEGIVSTSLEPEDEGFDPREYGDVVERAKERFEYVCDVDAENRKNQADDMRFAWERGAQWPEENRRARETANPKRPWLEFNQTGPYIKRITNEQRQNTPGLTARPVGSGASKAVANIYSGLIRSIEYCSNAPSIYDNAIEQAATGGAGYFRVITRYEREDSFYQSIELRPIPNALAAFLDPDAQLPDKSDAKYGFVCEWIDKETYKKEWPDDARNPCSWEAQPDSTDGRWYNGDLICVADYYEVVEEKIDLVRLSDGRTMWADKFDAEQKDLLEKAKANLPLGVGPDALPMPPKVLQREERTRSHVDWFKISGNDYPLAKYGWAGKYVPVIMVPGDEIDIDGKKVRQGVIRRLRDAQMMYNYWFTLATERIALAPKAPYVAIAGTFEGHDEWNSLNTDNHPYLEFEPVELADGTFVTQAPQRTEPIALDQGLVTMLQLCSQNLRDITGQKDAAQPNPNVPWRAILAEQRKGDLATFHYGDNLARAIQLFGKMAVDLIPKVYDTQRALRIIDEDGTDKQVTVNQAGVPGTPPINDLTTGEYECVVTVGPAYATRRVEAANEMQQFLEAMGEDKAALIGDIFAEMTDWPNGVGDKIARRLKAMLPPQVLAADEVGSQDPAVASMQNSMKQQGQQFQQQMQQVMQHVQQLTQENQKLQSEIYTERVNSAKNSLAAMQKVAASDRSLQIQSLETQDTQIHAAMDAKELNAKISNDKIAALIDFLARVVVPLVDAQQKQMQPVGAETNQIASEVSPQGATA
jgi:hypothetical protein